MPTVSQEEYLDIVDESGEPTGRTVARSRAHAEGILHRTSHVWLLRQSFNPERGMDEVQVLLQKRSDDKDSFPGCYDISSAGHIPAGCGFVESALRELQEELGISMEQNQLIALGNLRKSDTAVFHGKPFHDEQVSRVFYALCPLDESEFNLQQSEVSAVRWMWLSEIKTSFDAPDFKHCLYRDEISMLPSSL